MQDTGGSISALAGRALGGGVQASVPNKVQWGAGYLLSGSVGYGFGNGVRLELEGDYRTARRTIRTATGGRRRPA